MQGMHLLLRQMAGDDKELKKEALLTCTKMMRADSGVCIQLLKVNLLSNLILSVMREDQEVYQPLVEDVLRVAVDCPLRGTLLTKSSQFKKEKVRLGKILGDANKLGFAKSDTEKLLEAFLKTDSEKVEGKKS